MCFSAANLIVVLLGARTQASLVERALSDALVDGVVGRSLKASAIPRAVDLDTTSLSKQRRSDGTSSSEPPLERLEPVRLDWENITFAVGKRVILNGCSGAAPSGRMLAIMGPSGSGKTTLLNALAGQLEGGKSATLTGRLMVDGQQCGGASELPGLRMAYVRQEDVFYTQMTVRETLLFAARLRLPAALPLKHKEQRVADLIKRLGLDKAAHTIVGDAKRRGISGGERKRLAIGCELLSDPQLLFLDEPTSGLDAFAAQQVVNLLKKLADSGTTVIMSVHQPRGSIFNLFDDLLLLSEGHVMYSGPANSAAQYFANLGYKCPPDINAGEFVVDLVSTGYEPEHASERLKHLAACARRKQAVDTNVAKTLMGIAPGRAIARVARRSASSGATQFGLLFKRAFREVARSRTVLAIKIMQQVMISFIYGGIYSLGNTQSSIQDRFGLLSLVAIGAGNMAIASTIRAFPKEKMIVNAERAKGMYSIVPYFLSKVVAEAPVSAAVSSLGGAALYPLTGLNKAPGKLAKYLSTVVLEGFASGSLGLLIGAVAPSTDAALALFPPILVLMVIFNGFNIAEENAPAALRWIPKVSFIRWCSEGLAVNEFSGLKFECDRPGPCCTTGEEALERVSFGKSTVKGAALAQTKLISAFYLSTLYMLHRNQPKYLRIKPYSEHPPLEAPARKLSATEVSPEALEFRDEQESHIKDAFEILDIDKSRALEYNELKAAMEAFGHELPEDEEIHEIFNAADTDGNGMIDASENAEFVNKAQKPDVVVISV